MEKEKESEEVELQWAAIQKLPTFKRLRTSLVDHGKRLADVTHLGPSERHLIIHNLISHIQHDNLLLLNKLRDRYDRVNVKLPSVEVTFQNLSVDAECEVVRGKPLPTLWNSITSFLSVPISLLQCKSQKTKISILKDAGGIIKPSRMTLLLGPPGCGKTTLLLALAGKLDHSCKVTGEISYNGHRLDEFVPQKTSAYISQHDLHIPEMTVRETIDFSACCQGVGSRAETMMEVIRREKEAGIVPDPDIDTYMKATSVEGLRQNLQTDYVLKILGLDICGDVIVGDALKRGISGGQKKRLTTAEMIVGPTKALFMDEISNGLDSSTTFQIITCLQQMVHITDATALISLLQPAPETFNLFDDLILMSEGQILYHGPRARALPFFEECGFRCPERKGAADFLQEVISRRDQGQYWKNQDLPYNYVSADQFSRLFRASALGQNLNEELSRSSDQTQSQRNALSFRVYSLSKFGMFKACLSREMLLMRRHSFVYIFKIAQLMITAAIAMTMFIRTRMDVDLEHGNYYMGALFYTLVRLMTNGVAELAMTVVRLPVFYKQRDLYLYPAWAYSIPASLLKIPLSLVDAMLWTAVTYYVIGYSPEAGRFFCQFLLLFGLHMASTSMCRFIASTFQTMVAATTFGSIVLVLMFLFGGFIVPFPSLPSWLQWGFWLSPMSYGEIGISVNEFLAPRWQKVMKGNVTVGNYILSRHGLNFNGYFYWISFAALLGFTAFFDLGFIVALTYFRAPTMSRTIVSKSKIAQLNNRQEHESDVKIENEMKETDGGKMMVLPFLPLAMSFKDVQYYVDTPREMKERGDGSRKLKLLCDVTGSFRPGVLTALMGVSGAGKTTLMDVLCGRKTGGVVEGDIRIGGYRKVQATFARISGYCEQNDIHSPQITVEESLMYSAWLRLAPEIDAGTKSKFVVEVIETIELDDLKDSIVGVPGESGLSTEQRKRLTIAVELVSNPSIIFMDEPTSGLDARAAAIVVRAVKNVVAMGRTVVCTIHQPSIDVFEAFDELILMKNGGRIIYSGKLGRNSNKLIEYFESISGVPKIEDNYNPATWMLEVTSTSVEAELGLDFANVYNDSLLYQETIQLVNELSEPAIEAKELHFSTRFPQNGWVQFMACLWKQHLSYWRSPEYNVVRFVFMVAAAVLFGAVFWQKGGNVNNEQDLFNILGSMYIAIIFLGINNCSSVLPYIETERNVLYRERFAGMYSSWSYSIAQVTIEVPYILAQAMLYTAIIYPMMGFECSLYKICWFVYVTFCTFLYFVYLGMLMVSFSSTLQVASIYATAVYTILNLFSGFLIPGPKIPKWWVWCYWICPTAWSLNGLLTSQYGDMSKEILIFGELKPVSSFLNDYFGFRHSDLWIAALVLIAFPLVYASLFACFIRKLNFQKR